MANRLLDTGATENVITFRHDRIHQRTVTYRTDEILIYSRLVSDGSQIDEVDKIKIREFSGPLCYLHCGLGMARRHARVTGWCVGWRPVTSCLDGEADLIA